LSAIDITIKNKSINIQFFSNSILFTKMSDASKPDETDTGKTVGDAADTVATKAGEAIEATQKAIHSAVDPESTGKTIVNDVVKLTSDVTGAVFAGSQVVYDKVVEAAGEEPKE
jgi:hypothetical protein